MSMYSTFAIPTRVALRRLEGARAWGGNDLFVGGGSPVSPPLVAAVEVSSQRGGIPAGSTQDFKSSLGGSNPLGTRYSPSWRAVKLDTRLPLSVGLSNVGVRRSSTWRGVEVLRLLDAASSFWGLPTGRSLVGAG